MNRPDLLTILIVDDDSGHIELVRRNLRRAGINNPIITVNSGSEALDFIYCRDAYAKREGDRELLILLDINMPGGIDGIEVLRQIKGDPLTKKIPVLMLTTTDDPREVNRCYELGCSVYITKPVDPSEFIEAIQLLGLLLTVVTMPKEPKETNV